MDLKYSMFHEPIQYHHNKGFYDDKEDIQIGRDGKD